MEISANMRRAPLRLTTGAFVLNSGVTRFSADEETSRKLQTAAAKVVPRLEGLSPRTFSKVVGASEVTLGTALMLPMVPPALAGLGLAAFSASLLATRQNMPADGSTNVRPGTTEAWMLGAGTSLVLDAVTTPAHDKTVQVSAKLHEKAAAKKRHLRRSRRRAAAMSAVSAAHLGEKAHEAGAKLQDAGGRIVELRDEYQPVATKKLKRTQKKARKRAERLAAATRDSAQAAGERIQQAIA